MEIRKARKDDFLKLVEYNYKVFPEREDNLKKILYLWYSQSENEIENTFIIDDNGNIRGEVISSSMSYYYDGRVHMSRWGFDLFVDEELRKDNWGIDLMMTYNMQPSVFCTGSNDNALAINLKIGYKWLGSIRKYVKIVNPLYIFNGFFSGVVSINSFPVIVQDSCGFNYKMVQELSELGCYNEHLIEIRRTQDFLNWRLKSGLHDYAIYKKEQGSAYFIARTILHKHITALAIVDYRCNTLNENEIDSIATAAMSLVNKLHLPVLICSSSLKSVDDVFESHGFKSIGRPRPILGKEKGIGSKEHAENINARNYIFVTLLDSDGETSW